MSQQRAVFSRYETSGYVHPDDVGPERFWLTDEGNQALRHLHLNGACRDLGPAIFFPTKGEWADKAYAVCADCEVRTECLAFALNTTERDGVWGGTNEPARRPLLRRVAAGASPEDVAADYCSANDPSVRKKWTEENRAEALRIAAAAGPSAAAEATGVPYTTVKGWTDAQRRSARLNGTKGDTRTMTDAEVSELVERAVSVALAAQAEALSAALAETLAELVERLDTLTAATSSALHVLAPLDDALAEAAATVDQSASVPPEAAQSHENGLDPERATDG